MLLFFYIWMRWSLPRYRYDQLMAFGWKVLLPVAVLNLIVDRGRRALFRTLRLMLFYFFGALAVIASLLVIAQRNPVYSVLLLIASFGALSGLYVLLDAPFVAAIQIIVYAGAIMVLFLFVVMLLNAPHEDTDFDERTHPMLRPRPDAVRRGARAGARRRARLGAGAIGAAERVLRHPGHVGGGNRPRRCSPTTPLSSK